MLVHCITSMAVTRHDVCAVRILRKVNANYNLDTFSPMIKQIIIPMAAFAITVSGASAFTGSNWTSKLEVDLSAEQVSALKAAEEIRQSAEEEAKQVLVDAGLDEKKMKAIHDAMREIQKANYEAMEKALEAEDYDAWLEAAAEIPLSEKIASEADFSKLAEAHALREVGDREAADALMSELGLEGDYGMGMGHGHGMGMGEEKMAADDN